MPRGNLTVFCGPMFAGKTTKMLQQIHWKRHVLKVPCAVWKPAFDNRYGETAIISHDGFAAEALAIDRMPEVAPDTQVVFIDEVQFLEEPRYHGDAVSDVAFLLARGIDVTVSGIDTNWLGRPFPVIAGLLAMADQVVKLTASCMCCGRPTATRSFKVVPNDKTVELGAAGVYEARCNSCWHDHRHVQDATF